MGFRIGAVLLTILLLMGPLAMGSVAAAPTNEGEAIGSVVEESTQFESGEGAAVRTATAAEDQLIQTKTFIGNPADPGTISIEMQFSLPEQVVELTTAIPQNSTVTGTNGFAPDGNGNYTWDEDTANPSIMLSYSVNRSGRYHQRPVAAHTSEGLLFADTADWTIASIPSNNVWWKSIRSEPRVSFLRETSVQGAGIAGDRMVFLGDYTAHSETIDGQTMTLVVPTAASLEPSPGAIFDSLEAAATGLPEAPVERSLLIAAPTGVNWGPYGLADRSDTWVRADQRLDTPANVWLHEFVHLRQDFRTTAETRWIEEGMPEYYAALFTLHNGAIDFESFATHLERGSSSRYEDTVLSQPGTWAPRANYAKGALVYGTLDREIRQVSEQSAASLQLFQALNEHDGRIDQSVLEEEITSLANAGTADDFTRYSSTTATPEMWTAQVHTDAFGTAPANLETSIEDSFRLAGPYRNRSVRSIPPLVPGETLSVPVTVTNEGEATGSYELELQVDGRTVATGSGSLAGGAETSVELNHTFNETGGYTLKVDNNAWSVTVSEPRSPIVQRLSSAETSVRVGETTNVTAVIGNPGSIPASGTIAVSKDGTAMEEWQLRLDVNETVERRLEIQISEAGSSQLTAGDKTLRIEGITSEGATGTSAASGTVNQPASTETQTPGFSIPSYVVAVVLLSGIIRLRFE